MARCSGDHRFYVAETVAVPTEGTVHVIAICTDCGEPNFKSFVVAKPGATIHLGSENKTKQEKP
jgi:hypothetical protein